MMRAYRPALVNSVYVYVYVLTNNSVVARVRRALPVFTR